MIINFHNVPDDMFDNVLTFYLQRLSKDELDTMYTTYLQQINNFRQHMKDEKKIDIEKDILHVTRTFKVLHAIINHSVGSVDNLMFDRQYLKNLERNTLKELDQKSLIHNLHIYSNIPLNDPINIPSREHTTMATGTQYLRQAHQNYAHLRRMLQDLWDWTGAPASERFDIDARFLRDWRALSNYINAKFQPPSIDSVHQHLVSKYKSGAIGRGRPAGALNRDTIDKLAGKSFDIGSPLPPPLPLSELSTPKSPTYDNFNPDDYATKRELYDAVDGLAVKDDFTTFRNDVASIVDETHQEVQSLRNKIAMLEQVKKQTIEIKKLDGPTISVGIQHRNFALLMNACQAKTSNNYHLNIWCYGPAGSGKSTAGEKIADAFGLKPYSMNKQSTEYGILGFINATGYQTTEFRKAYENGGVFVGDEIDGWTADATIALNGALANGHCTFPDKNVKRHPDFIFIAAANTTGLGGNLEYVGRMKQDAAFNDRFVYVPWPHDDILEDALVADKSWLKRVRHVREAIQRNNIKNMHLVTMRASIHGEALLRAGLSVDDVESLTLRKGITDAQWNMVKPTFTYDKPLSDNITQEAAE